MVHSSKHALYTIPYMRVLYRYIDIGGTNKCTRHRARVTKPGAVFVRKPFHVVINHTAMIFHILYPTSVCSTGIDTCMQYIRKQCFVYHIFEKRDNVRTVLQYVYNKKNTRHTKALVHTKDWQVKQLQYDNFFTLQWYSFYDYIPCTAGDKYSSAIICCIQYKRGFLGVISYTRPNCYVRASIPTCLNKSSMSYLLGD